MNNSKVQNFRLLRPHPFFLGRYRIFEVFKRYIWGYVQRENNKSILMKFLSAGTQKNVQNVDHYINSKSNFSQFIKRQCSFYVTSQTKLVLLISQSRISRRFIHVSKHILINRTKNMNDIHMIRFVLEFSGISEQFWNKTHSHRTSS